MLNLFLLSIISFVSSYSYSQTLNPDISANLRTLYQNAKRQSVSKTEEGSGFSLEEVEVLITSDVDAYLRASILLAVHPGHEEHNTDELPAAEEAEPEELGYAIEPEEAYIESISLPYITVKAGKFKTALGRHNTLHPHAFPFLDAPLVNTKILGEEGLNETGISAAVLMPLPWFVEFTGQAVQGDSPAVFASQSVSDIASIYRLRSLVELSDTTTFDLGISRAWGANFFEERTHISSADLSVKWRPITGGRYTSINFVAEYLKGSVNGRPEDSDVSGLAYWLQYQFGERWWLQARGENVTSENDGTKTDTKYSALLGFFPSEFSALRLQYDRLFDGEKDPLNRISLQAIVSIGAHPAHNY